MLLMRSCVLSEKLSYFLNFFNNLRGRCSASSSEYIYIYIHTHTHTHTHIHKHTYKHTQTRERKRFFSDISAMKIKFSGGYILFLNKKEI